MASELIKLDKRDKKILQELEINSRQSFKEIGKKCDLRAETVEYRVQKWLENGFLLQLFAEPNRESLGLKTYRLYLKTANMPPHTEKKFVNEFSTKPSVQWFAITHGDWDYIIRFSLPNETAFKQEVENAIREFGKFITAKGIGIATYASYFPVTYALGTPRETWIQPKKSGTARIDETDEKILFYLYENARAPTTEIAQKIGLSPDAVQYRLKKLLNEQIIERFTCYINRKMLGYSFYKVFYWMQYLSPDDEQAFLTYCQNHPNVLHINRVIGSWDFEIDFDARNPEELHGMLKTIQQKFNSIIKTYSTTFILRDFITNPFKKKTSP